MKSSPMLCVRCATLRIRRICRKSSAQPLNSATSCSTRHEADNAGQHDTAMQAATLIQFASSLCT